MAPARIAQLVQPSALRGIAASGGPVPVKWFEWVGLLDFPKLFLSASYNLKVVDVIPYANTHSFLIR